MKFLYFLFLLAFAAAVGLFAYQNNRPETVTFLDRQWELGLPALVGLAYLAGMLSGWTVVGLLRRSVNRTLDDVRYA